MKIHLFATGGLADVLRQIYRTYKFAKKNNINDIFIETQYYKSSNLFDFFDFSEFEIKLDQYDNNFTNYFKINGSLDEFFCEYCKKNKFLMLHDRNKLRLCDYKCIRNYVNKNYINYPVMSCCNDVFFGSFFCLSKIFISEKVKSKFFNFLHTNKLKNYTSIHIRSTDRSKEYCRYNFKNLDEYIYKKIVPLIENSYNQVYVSTDDKYVIDKISSTTKKKFYFNNEICYLNGSKNLHSKGNKDSKNLLNAIIDLLVLAGGDEISVSLGGFSRLAFQLWNDKKLYEKLTGIKKDKGNNLSIINDIMNKNYEVIAAKHLKSKMFY